MRVGSEIDAAEMIEIVCACDSSYVPHLAALLSSIESCKGEEKIRVHLILDSVAQSDVAQIVSDVPGLRLQVYHVNEHPALELPPLLQISRATYLRLMMDEVLDPSIKRLIFLDVDMIVTTSLHELWVSDLGGRPIGAVVDPGIDPERFSRTHSLEGSGSYFNAGMLVVDMVKARELKIFPKALRHLLRNPTGFVFADQDALNMVLWQKWTPLDVVWNFQRKFLYREYRSSIDSGKQRAPNIIHYTEAVKPWQRQEWHPLEWLYWRSLRRTSFFCVVTSREKIGWLRLAKSLVRFSRRRSAVYCGTKASEV